MQTIKDTIGLDVCLDFFNTFITLLFMKTLFIIIAILSATALLAFYGASDEGYPVKISVVFALLPVLILGLINWIAFEVKVRKPTVSITFIGAMVINTLVLAGYLLNALDGQSNPDTAGHMAPVAFPILMAVVSAVLLAPLLIIDFLTRNKKSN